MRVLEVVDYQLYVIKDGFIKLSKIGRELVVNGL